MRPASTRSFVGNRSRIGVGVGLAFSCVVLRRDQRPDTDAPFEENAMSTTPGKPRRELVEHRSVTLGDLAAFIAGVAVVLVLPTRQSYWPYPVDFRGPWPRWLPWCFCLRQALARGVHRTRAGRSPATVGLRRVGPARRIPRALRRDAVPGQNDRDRPDQSSYRLKYGISLPGFGLDGISVQLLERMVRELAPGLGASPVTYRCGGAGGILPRPPEATRMAVDRVRDTCLARGLRGRPGAGGSVA